MPSTRVSFHQVASAGELAQMTELLAATALSSSTPDDTVLSEIPSAFVSISATGATYRNEPVSRYNPIDQLFFAAVGLTMAPNSNDNANDNDYYYNSSYDVTYYSVDVGAVMAGYHPNSSTNSNNADQPEPHDNHPMAPLVQLLHNDRIVKVVHDGRGLVDALAHNHVPEHPDTALFPDCVLIGPCLDTSLLPLLLGNSTAVMTTVVCRDGTPLSELRRKSNGPARHHHRGRHPEPDPEPQLVHQHHYVDPYLPRALRGVCKLPSLADTLNYYYLLQPVQNPYAAMLQYYDNKGEESSRVSNATQATDAFASSPYSAFCHCTNVWSIGMSALAHARRMQPDLTAPVVFTPQLCGTLLALLGIAVSQFHPESLCLSYGFDNVVIRNKQTLRRYNQQDGDNADDGFGPHGSHHYHRGGQRRRDVVVALAPDASMLPDTIKADIARSAAQEVFDVTSRFHNIMAFYVYKGGAPAAEGAEEAEAAAARHFRELLAHSRGGNYLPFGVLQPLPPPPTPEQLRAADTVVESEETTAREEPQQDASPAAETKTRKERRKERDSRKQRLADFQEQSHDEARGSDSQVLLYDVHVCHQCGLPFSKLHVPAKIARARQHALTTAADTNSTCANCVERSLPCEFYRRGCCHHAVGGEAEDNAVPTNVRRCDYKHVLLPCPFGTQCIKAHAEALQCREAPAFIGAGSCPYTHPLTTDVKHPCTHKPEPLPSSLAGGTTPATATAATATATTRRDTAAPTATAATTWSQEIKPVIENRRSIAEALRQHQLEAAERRTQRTQQPCSAVPVTTSVNTHNTRVSPFALVTALAASGRPQPRMSKTPCPRYFYTVLGCPLSEAQCPYSHTPVPVYVPVPVLIKRQEEADKKATAAA